MTSFVWEREPSEAFSEPYEYGGQEQFSREAQAVLEDLKFHYSKLNHSFSREDKSVEKAVWLLQVDSLSALYEGLMLIGEKRHRIASRLFRDVIETMDASLYFSQAGLKSRTNLEKWYKDEVIPHRVCREFIKKHQGEDKFERLRSVYRDLSKYTHRTYRALLMSYMLGKDDNLAYDGFRKYDTDYALPHVISFSYAVLGMLIKRFVEFSIITNQITVDEAKEIWRNCLEPETVPRRFGSGSGQIMRGPPTKIDFS
ncbi:hypothetical protein [Thiomicrorhabdus sp. Kp2]|uniref:hypothetical protein n=1 Tax=Thiomicrorhabdus sp. Kp2 TaxID=1123518 RepID=UPI00040881AA|nr:hypothetical protein [Thiomicrorhabdus sp. Kp2]